MKKVEINVYSIDELSDTAKRKAYYKWSSEMFYFHDNDEENSFNIFLENFNCDDLIDRFDDDTKFMRLHSVLLRKYSHILFQGKYYGKLKTNLDGTTTHIYRHSKVLTTNDCVLTGYYMDNDILQPMYDFLDAPYPITYEELIDECKSMYEKTYQDVLESQSSFESFLECCESQEYEFLENGEFFKN